MRTIGIAFILAHTTKYAVGSTDDNINNLENVCSYRTSDTNKLKACFGPLENVQCNVPEISDGSECKNLEETTDLFQQVYDGMTSEVEANAPKLAKINNWLEKIFSNSPFSPCLSRRNKLAFYEVI